MGIHDLLSNEVLSNEVLSNEVLSKALFGHIIETHQNGYFYRNCAFIEVFFSNIFIDTLTLHSTKSKVMISSHTYRTRILTHIWTIFGPIN